MHYYSATSVIAELQANSTLICEGIGDLGCPSPAPLSSTHEGNCIGDPSTCIECNNQSCNQWITIRSDKYVKLSLLFFCFLFKGPYEGRIRRDDSLLLRLIQKDLINKNNLVIC